MTKDEFVAFVGPVIAAMRNSTIPDIQIEYGRETKKLVYLKVRKYEVKIRYTNVGVYMSIWYFGTLIIDDARYDSDKESMVHGVFETELCAIHNKNREVWRTRAEDLIGKL